MNLSDESGESPPPPRPTSDRHIYIPRKHRSVAVATVHLLYDVAPTEKERENRLRYYARREEVFCLKIKLRLKIT